MESLREAIVQFARNTRYPTGGDPYGYGATIVVCGRESRLHGEGWQVSEDTFKSNRCCEMQGSLRKDLVHADRGKRNLKLERVYRELYDADRYLACYARLYPNNGAMTPGVTQETVDAMSEEKVAQIFR